jgi:hypothetical protein
MVEGFLASVKNPSVRFAATSPANAGEDVCN